MNNPPSPKGLPTATSLPVQPEVALEPVFLMAGEQDWEQLADVPFTYGVSAGGGLATDGNYLYAADFSGDGDGDYIDLNGNLVDDIEERLDSLGIGNGSVRFARYNPATDTWDSLPTF